MGLGDVLSDNINTILKGVYHYYDSYHDFLNCDGVLLIVENQLALIWELDYPRSKDGQCPDKREALALEIMEEFADEYFTEVDDKSDEEYLEELYQNEQREEREERVNSLLNKYN